MAVTGQTTSQIRVAGTGHLYIAPVGTAAPTDVTTAWGAGWQDLGFTDESGVVVGKKDSWDSINLWQTTVPARMVPKSRAFTAKFTLEQINAVTLPLWAGGGTVSTNGASGYLYTISETLTSYERALGIEWTDNNGAITTRIIIPRGQVSDTTDITLTRDKSASLGITYDALGIDGVTPLAYWYSNDPNLTP
ncbi:phage tail protein [Kitasatospora acidiphila]|uniref:Phage tail protein n=1 Tax=Kitasatospora acidiphila TaxID=2567942 RepID=A0A540W4L7_9ACTN|nr:phage tail protein [Kitasatospora acidiphila]TQF03932.1 phage tail protein [Kitasatospora acidiphila]